MPIAVGSYLSGSKCLVYWRTIEAIGLFTFENLADSLQAIPTKRFTIVDYHESAEALSSYFSLHHHVSGRGAALTSSVTSDVMTKSQALASHPLYHKHIHYGFNRTRIEH